MYKPALIILTVSFAGALVACDRQRDEGVGEGVEYSTQEQQKTEAEGMQPTDEEIEKVAGREQPTAEGEQEEMQEPAELAQSAADTLQKMKSDEQLKPLLQRAQGLFIVPRYGRAGLVVAGRGGQGVVVARNAQGKWSGPAFYDVGGISLGVQVGAEGGEVALLLMSEQAVESFEGENTFSINADAKLTLVDYSTVAGATAGETGDVVFWSDTEGAFGGVALSATNVSLDEEENRQFYGRDVTAQAILDGQVTAPESALGPQLADL